MNLYRLYWLDGKTEVVKGSTAGAAMTLAGYGAGALRALDFYSDITESDDVNQYIFVNNKSGWTKGDRSQPIH